MITTYRDEFIGGHVTPEVKDALKEQALKETNGSVSRLLYKLLVESLRQRGHELKEDAA